MTNCPSFKGFRSPDGTREDRIALYREHVREASAGNSHDSIDWQSSIDVMEGELGLAWAKLAHVLSSATSDPAIAKNPTCIELLQILTSIANAVDGSEDIDGVLGVLEPVFVSRNAWVNSINSKPSPEARRWILSQWHERTDLKQSKRAFARVYRELVKKKFDIVVTEETIYRDWLPKTK